MLIAIALYHARKIHARDDFFLAGRSMSRWPIAMSMYVALFSTNTFVGVIGWVNRPTARCGSVCRTSDHPGRSAGCVPLSRHLLPPASYHSL